MSAGKLKVFASLSKRDDHLMDATRYLVMSGRDRMRTMPAGWVSKRKKKPAERELAYSFPGQEHSWMT